jgi:hypothetical protein
MIIDRRPSVWNYFCKIRIFYSPRSKGEIICSTPLEQKRQQLRQPAVQNAFTGHPPFRFNQNMV